MDIVIGHANRPSDADELETRLRRTFDNIRRVTKTELGTAFGVHGGPGTIVISVQPWQAPEPVTRESVSANSVGA